MSLCLPKLSIFLIYSKKGRSALSHEGIQNFPSDVCYEVAHYQVPFKKQGLCKTAKITSDAAVENIKKIYMIHVLIYFMGVN